MKHEGGKKMKRRITKAQWKALDGLRNSKLSRRQTPSGRWLYYITD